MSDANRSLLPLSDQRKCGHEFVLTAICSECRIYANQRLGRKLAARKEAPRGT